jgi:hypothetical protein
VVPDVEQAVFAAAGVDVDAFRAWLRDADLALVVSRNVTQRDRGDRHQPYNLRVPGGVESIGAEGTVYDVAFLQFFQATRSRLRRSGHHDARPPAAGAADARARRVAGGGCAVGAVKIGADGSMAALVPARRAMSWQLTDPNGEGVVRERNWLSFSRARSACARAATASTRRARRGIRRRRTRPRRSRSCWPDGRRGPASAPAGAA